MAMDSDGIASEIQEYREETEQMSNKLIVETLYESLALRDSEMVSKLLAEWWFHGPPGSQHMMRVLTGESVCSHFEFWPRRVTPIWDCVVIAEGWEGDEAYWVHVVDGCALDDSKVPRVLRYVAHRERYEAAAGMGGSQAHAHPVVAEPTYVLAR